MNLRTPLIIETVVGDAERAALVAAAQQLRECLEAATGAAWPVDLRFRESIAAIDLPDRPTIVIASFLPEVERQDEPMASTEARWREDVGSLDGAFLCVLVCTIFRCVTTEPGRRHVDGSAAIAERIRRLNLFAAELSHDTGVGVIDIDRVFAHIGARELGTDYRLTGTMAAEVAAHAIVSGLLAIGLDDVVAPDVQNRAMHFHGDVSTLIRFVTGSRQRDRSR